MKITKSITLYDIQKIMNDHYFLNFGGNNTRDMILTPSKSSHGAIGHWLMALIGSPPKGYSLYIPEHSLLAFYNVRGKPYNNRRSCDIPELDKLRKPKEFVIKYKA